MRIRPRTIPATLLALALLPLIPAAAAADGSSAGSFELRFTSRTPGSPTGMSYREVYLNPSNPATKPSPVRKTVLKLPSGSVVDGQAIAACQASDTELMLLGPAACPAASHIGQGTATVMSGFGPPFDPFVSDADLFNGGNQTIELFAPHGTGVTVQAGHQQYSGPSTLTESPAPIPGGPPDGQSAPSKVEFSFGLLVGPSGRAFITTPPSCPPTGQWISALTFTNADGHTYILTSSTPCHSPISHRSLHHRRTHCRTGQARGRLGQARCWSGCVRHCRSKR